MSNEISRLIIIKPRGNGPYYNLNLYYEFQGTPYKRVGIALLNESGVAVSFAMVGDSNGLVSGYVQHFPANVSVIHVSQEGHNDEYHTISFSVPIPVFNNFQPVVNYIDSSSTFKVAGYIPLNWGADDMSANFQYSVDFHGGDNGAIIKSVAVARTGKWEVDLPAPLGNRWFTCRFNVHQGGRHLDQSGWAENINIIGLGRPLINTQANGVVGIRPTITGSNGNPGLRIDLVEADVGGTIYGSGIVNQNGTWSIPITTPLPARNFRMTGRQNMGEWYSEWANPVAFTVMSPPIITVPSGTIDMASRAVSGTVVSSVADVQINIYRDVTNDIVGQGVVDSSSKTWKGTFNSELAPGIHVLSAAQNYYQTLSERGPTLTFRVRPGEVTDIVADVGQVPMVVFSGKGLNGAVVKFEIHGVFHEVTVSGGTWRASPVRMRPDGGDQIVRFLQSIKTPQNDWIDSFLALKYIHIDTPKPSGTLVRMEGEILVLSGTYYFFQGLTTVIRVSINNVSWGSHTMTNDGPWEIRGSAPPPGTHTVKVSGISNNQLSVEEVLAPLVIRPKAPHDISVVANGFSPQISGKCWPLAQLPLKYSDKDTEHVPTGTTEGTWSFRRDLPFTPGDHTFTVKQLFGDQTSPAMGPVRFNIATPAVTITEPAGGASDVSLRAVVKGIGAYVGAVIKVYDAKVGGKLLGEQAVTVAGAWSLALMDEFLAEGSHTLYAVQEYAKQASARSAEVNFNVRLPKPEVTRPSGGSIERYAEYSGKGWPLSKVTLTRVGVPGWAISNIPVDGEGLWKVIVQVPEVGPQTLAINQQYKAFSRDGNDQAYNVTPNVPCIESPIAGELTSARTVVSGWGFAGDKLIVVNPSISVMIDVEVAADGSWSAPLNTLLPPGPYTIKAKARGHTTTTYDSAYTELLNFVVAGEATSIDEPVAGDWTGIYPWVGGRDTPGAKITVASVFNAEEVLAPVATVDETGHWRVALNKPLLVGANWLQARAERPSGELSDWACSGRFFCEIHTAGYQAPTVLFPQLGAEVGLLPVLSGGGLPGAEVFVTTPEDKATALAQATVGRDGRWTVRFKRPLTANTNFSYVVRLGRDAVASAYTPVRTLKVVQVAANFEAPIVTSHKEGDVVDQRFWVSGLGRPGAQLTLHKQTVAAPWATTEVDASGHWQVCFENPLDLGEIHFQAQQILDGKSSQYSPGIKVTVAEAMAATILDSPTGDTQVAPVTKVCGRGYPQATVTLVKSGEPYSNWGSSVVDAKGYWEIWTRPLPVGPIRLNAKQELSGKPGGGWMKQEFTLHAVIAG